RGSGTRYFIGRFDGLTFRPDDPDGPPLWLDYGRDNYAGGTWSDAPDGQRLFIGWMSNLDYAQSIPADTFRGIMTLPRRLSLRRFEEGIRLVSEPVEALTTLRTTPPLLELGRQTLAAGRSLGSGDCLEIEAEFRVGEDGGEFGLKLRRGAAGEVRVGYDADNGQMFVDRRHCGGYVFPDETQRHTAPLAAEGGRIGLRILLDRQSVEVFGNGGRQVITDLIFPPPDALGVELYLTQGPVELEGLALWRLAGDG
ncbi:MAG: GH32 C-terminal domain-containing protein, partial [Candidatus Competibacteraceae bacterium]|nr:GH32 C-terminal domain-containing protein [Candidatus Competibacteraceae bacterium]